jgi:respiratory burst oxidase
MEVGIVILDAGPIVSFLQSPSREEAILYFSFFAAFVILRGVRIFHIFHVTARPPKLVEAEVKKGAKVDKIHSITGVWVSKRYSAMSFAATDLVKTLPNLSPFSLQFFGTREIQKTSEETFKEMVRGNHSVRAGRPDWDSMFYSAIAKAHATNPEGEAVGVFFCGAPAIARVLQTTAQKVTAEHQYTTGMSCRCRVLVHSETS